MSNNNVPKDKNKTNSFFAFNVFHKLSISTQVIITIILLFASFFALQAILNNQFFKNYYVNREFENIQDELTTYVDGLNNPDYNYYDVMYDFTQENNAYSVITSKDYRILTSSYTNYSFTLLHEITGESYNVLVPESDYPYAEGDLLNVVVIPYNDALYSAATISDQELTFYIGNISCEEVECTTIAGPITSLNKPNNLNYLFAENLLVKTEVSKLSNNAINLTDHAYEFADGETAYWYRSYDGPEDSLVFVHDLDTWNWIITIIPIADSDDIVSIISSYNYYVYMTAIAIIIMWSFRISSIISKPIKNIEGVARQIAKLNFDIEATEMNNKENTSLSNSINLISKNLKEALENLSRNNQELIELYEAQSKQVKLKKQLVSSISHELKTPLMVMQVIIQGILDSIIAKEDINQELENVIDEINKSSSMIQDMLQIYRLDNAETELDLNEYDLSIDTELFVKEFEHTINQNKLDLVVNIHEQVFVEADQNLIKQVISNYMTNAIKYTPKGEIIYLEVSESRNEAYFELTNHGVTIDEEELKKIWLPFYRIKHETLDSKTPKGSGIGLYLVNEILTAHDAKFGIENTENGVKSWFALKKKT